MAASVGSMPIADGRRLGGAMMRRCLRQAARWLALRADAEPPLEQ
jgi:hypothetical protein